MPPRPIHFIIFLLVLRRMYMQCALRFNTQEITRSFVSRGSINHSFQSHGFARVVIKKKTYNRHGGTVDGICSCKLNTRLSSTSRKKGGGNQAAGVRMRKMRETWERRGKIRLGSPWSAARATLIHRFVPPLIPSLRLPLRRRKYEEQPVP